MIDLQEAVVKELNRCERERRAAMDPPSQRCGASSHSWLGTQVVCPNELVGVLVDLQGESGKQDAEQETGG